MIISFFAALITAGLLTWLLNTLELIPWKRSAGAHWTQQARKLHVARVGRVTTFWSLLISIPLAGQRFIPDCPWLLLFAGAFLGSLLGGFPMDRAIIPGLTFRHWAHIAFAGNLVELSVWGVYACAGWFMPPDFGWPTCAVAATFLVFHAALQLGLGVKMLRLVRLIRPASPRLQSLVDEASQRMGVPVRKTWEYERRDANAVAFVVTKDLAFTTRLLDSFSDEEIKAVCAHELGHLSETRAAVAGRLLGSLKFFPLIFIRPVLNEFGSGGLTVLWILMLMIWFAGTKLSHKMEKRADQIANQNTSGQTLYARALERIYEINLVPVVTGQQGAGTHPHLYDRMCASGVTPDYPRPEAPPSFCWSSSLMIVVAMIFALTTFL